MALDEFGLGTIKSCCAKKKALFAARRLPIGTIEAFWFSQSPLQRGTGFIENATLKRYMKKKIIISRLDKFYLASNFLDGSRELLSHDETYR